VVGAVGGVVSSGGLHPVAVSAREVTAVGGIWDAEHPPGPVGSRIAESVQSQLQTAGALQQSDALGEQAVNLSRPRPSLAGTVCALASHRRLRKIIK